jgi:hypothetical protein
MFDIHATPIAPNAPLAKIIPEKIHAKKSTQRLSESIVV